MRVILPALLLPACVFAQLGDLQDSWSRDQELKGASITYCVMKASTGEVLAQQNSELSVVPASTLKIFTTGAALNILGPSYRFETRLCYSGTIDPSTGILTGDVIISGGGDPTLGSEEFPKADLCQAWSKILAGKGIRRITGAVIGDASCWERKVPDQWIWGDIGNYYGAPPNGLSYRDNKFQVFFTSGKPKSAAAVTSITPQYRSRKIVLTASVTCEGGEDKAFMYGDPGSYDRYIEGFIPANKGSFSLEGSLPDPALLCAEELLGALENAGIRCDGGARSLYARSSASLQVLDRRLSPPLADIVRATNIKSNNLFCESLVFALGSGNHTKGLAMIRDLWKNRGFDVSGLFLTDGSGLSRASTCNSKLQCQALLDLRRDSTLNGHFRKSLPIAGRQGSMGSIGKGTPIENNMRAKTGYIQRVRAYCGYVTTTGGEELIFSIIFNNYNCSPRDARLRIEKFLLLLPGL
jgi:serine-type D-Ala-D-Ala carboxypeptidase/endopeptidase (penicillin-binding protein 4)